MRSIIEINKIISSLAPQHPMKGPPLPKALDVQWPWSNGKCNDDDYYEHEDDEIYSDHNRIKQPCLLDIGKPVKEGYEPEPTPAPLFVPPIKVPEKVPVRVGVGGRNYGYR